MAITVTSSNPTRVTAVSFTATTNTTYPTSPSFDRNYVFPDDIIGMVNTGVLVTGFGLRLETPTLNGDIMMINNGGVAANGLPMGAAALELVGNGGSVSYGGTG